MDSIRSVIMAACLMGTVSTMLDMAAPEGSAKVQMLRAMGLVMILTIVSFFAGEGFRVDLDSMQLPQKVQQQDMYGFALAQAEESYEEYFTQLLNKNNIGVENMVVQLVINSRNEAEVSEVEVETADSSQAQAASDLIKGELPQVRVRTVKRDEADR